MKPATHTYVIKNPMTGQERVVHRNLLMLVNFLPVDVDSHADRTFQSSSEAGSGDFRDATGLLSFSESGDSVNRTQQWVDNLSAACSDSCEGAEPSSRVLSMADEPESVSDLHHQASSVTSERDCLSAPSTITQGGNRQLTPSTHSGPGDVQPVRSRFGRIVKPVNRLLHVMSTQEVVNDASQIIGKVSKSIRQAFQ